MSICDHLSKRKPRAWDREKQDEFHDRLALYESRRSDKDFIEAHFDPAEIAKIQKFVAYENVLKNRFSLYMPKGNSFWFFGNNI